MRRICLVFLIAFARSASLFGQATVTPLPQSARQALIEMFLGKGDEAFTKHLPEDARRTLIRKGETPETSTILRISAIGRQMAMQSEHIETFETGPTLLVNEQNNHREKIEVDVERDSLIGDNDEIELSVHYYKDGQLQPLPIVPRLTFTLTQEKDIWRLIEITAAAHVPLTDPDYLKGLRRQENEATEGQVKQRIETIAGAETSYAAKHPDLGYTCSLQSLFAADPNANPGENGAFFDPGQGNDEWNGYHFALAGCEGNPPAKYHVTAMPTVSDTGMRTFCSDESGSVKFVVEKPSACLTRGKPANAENAGTD